MLKLRHNVNRDTEGIEVKNKNNSQRGSALLAVVIVLAVVILIFVAWQWLRNREPEDVSIRISEVGLQTPESVLYNVSSDQYLVSNINGTPLEEDDNGFISKISSEGKVEELKWINGEDENITLNAPKGMAVANNKLYVSDINVVRVFNADTGESEDEIAIEGTSFLNDITADNSGAVYVSDSGLDASFASTGTDAIYKITSDNEVSQLIADTELKAPNGLVLAGSQILVGQFMGNEIKSINMNSGNIETFATLPAGQIDGLVRLGNGIVFASSWESESIYRVNENGESSVEFDNLPAPADIGFDSERERLLIPLFNDNAIEIKSIK